MSPIESKIVVCDNAKTCNKFCDGHKIPHHKNFFCRRQECMKTGEIVMCVPEENQVNVNKN
jgi:hypothetical protein